MCRETDSEQRRELLGMKPPQITEEMYARIPALLEQGMTKTGIAAMWGVKLGTLKVFCSRRGISLRKGGPLRLHTKLLLLPEAGVAGNSHMMMMDKNNLQVGAMIKKWLDGAVK